MKVADYKELEVWKRGIKIVDRVYELMGNIPKDEKFGLAVHMQRTAISIPSNIAEGFVRQYTKEYMQFLYIALGSCAELETQLFITLKRGYINESDFVELEDELRQEMKMLNGLIRSLNK